MFILDLISFFENLFSPTKMTTLVTTKTPLQDAQGPWYQLLSPTQVLTGDNEVPMVKTTTKKKCHGNRKAQRQRRKLRRQEKQQNEMDHEMNDVTIQDDVVHLDTEEEEESTQRNNKRKRDALSNDRSGPLSQSLSQLSISPQKVVKQPKLDVIERDEQEQQGQCNEKCQRTPKYLSVPDAIFVRLLSKAIEHGKPIIQWLNTKEKIDFIRQMVKVTNDIRYFDLQRQFWQDHYDLSLKEGIWGMEYARSYARQHRVCRAYSFKKPIIEQGLMMAKTELHRNLEVLQKCMLQLETNATHWQPTIDHGLLSYAIDELVQQEQKRLRQEFEYKKKMLEKDAKDHYLIRSFYWIKPNQEQISLAKKIWQTTADAFQTKQQEEILRKRISLRRLPHSINKIIDRTIKDTEMQLSESIMDRDQRASLGSACSKLVTQYKFDLSCLHLQVIENNRRGYQTVLTQLLKELSDMDWSDTIKQAILDRQNSLVDRYEAYLVHKLNTFFVEAPMV